MLAAVRPFDQPADPLHVKFQIIQTLFGTDFLVQILQAQVEHVSLKDLTGLLVHRGKRGRRMLLQPP